MCTGALAAVAVSCANSVIALVPLALHTIAITVRLGALAWDVADRISTHNVDDGARFKSWTAAVAGSSADDVASQLRQYTTSRVSLIAWLLASSRMDQGCLQVQ